MKVNVKEVYQDKMTSEHHYIGEVLEIKDTKRVDELVKAGVVEVVEEPKATTKKATVKK